MHLNYVNMVFFVGLISLKNSLSYRLPLEGKSLIQEIVCLFSGMCVCFLDRDFYQ